MSTLERKLGRDLWRLKGQVATIALVLACGIMAMIMLRSTWHSLLGARDAYYERYRFGDVFARLERAPDAVARRLEQLPGVAVVEHRIVRDVMVPMPSEPDPIAGRLISLPESGEPALDALYLQAGRLPEPGTTDEAVILAQFAEAQHVELGDRLPVVIGGKLRSVQVVGFALSPEFVLAMSGRDFAPDNRRFVVLWMPRAAIAPAFQMDGAFDDVVMQLEPDASLPAVLEAVDRELAPYGGLHAIGRERQVSNYALTNELSVLRTIAMIIPTIFLLVAAFLVNVVISRLVFLERTQIAVLKALGFTDRRIAVHYLTLVALIVGIAAVLGIALGMWSGRWMTNLYGQFYRFPTRLFEVQPTMVISTIGIGLAAAVAGALYAVRRIAKLPPAEAMRPPAPLSYRRGVIDKLGIDRAFGPAAMMVVREIQRRPARFTMSAVGIAMGIAIFVMGRFSWDSFQYLMDEQFDREHQEDLSVALTSARPARAVGELEHVPGVVLAEGQRIVPVRFRAGPRFRDVAIIGIAPRAELRHLIDRGTTLIEPPPSGLLMTDKLAELLGVGIGDSIEVELLEGSFEIRAAEITGLIEEPFGLQAYAEATWLASLLHARIAPPDPALLDARSRDEATARLAAAAARRQRAETAVARAIAARDLAIKEASRAAMLVERGAIPIAERDRIDLEAALAGRDVTAAETERAAAVAEVAAARAVLGDGTSKTRAPVAVFAPAGGRILRVLRDSAGPVSAGAPLFELGDPRAIEVVVDVLSSDATRIRPGMEVGIEGWGGEPLRATVHAVEPSGFTRLSALGVEEQRVNIVIRLAEPPPSLGDGFRVDARIILWRGTDVLAVPSGAVFRHHDRWAVYVVEDDRARLRVVELGHRGRQAVEVTSGLADGAAIVLHPGDRVGDGAQVRAR